MSIQGQGIRVIELEGKLKEESSKCTKLERELSECKSSLQRIAAKERALEDHQISVEMLNMIAKTKTSEATELSAQIYRLKNVHDEYAQSSREMM